MCKQSKVNAAVLFEHIAAAGSSHVLTCSERSAEQCNPCPPRSQFSYQTCTWYTQDYKLEQVKHFRNPGRHFCLVEQQSQQQQKKKKCLPLGSIHVRASMHSWDWPCGWLVAPCLCSHWAQLWSGFEFGEMRVNKRWGGGPKIHISIKKKKQSKNIFLGVGRGKKKNVIWFGYVRICLDLFIFYADLEYGG